MEGKRKHDKSIIHLPRHYFPELRIACKMGVSRAMEVEFTIGLLLLQGKNLIELKLIDGISVNIYTGCHFLYKLIKR